MLKTPPELVKPFLAALKDRAVPPARHGDSQKWLRSYLDYGAKYNMKTRRRVLPILVAIALLLLDVPVEAQRGRGLGQDGARGRRQGRGHPPERT